MEDVTDAAFRRLIAQKGKPDVTWTEFTSADGLVLAPPKGQEALRKKLLYTEAERPIVAQLFSSRPERMEAAAKLCAELGFDGIDINMGCPDRAVEKGGAGAALIKTPQIARELIRAAKRGAAVAGKEIPVSVKTRVGYNKDELDTWLPHLLEEEPAVVTIHARTRKELSLVPAVWNRVKRAVAIRDAMGSKALIIGNGDARDIVDAREKAAEAGCDGVMLGRAIFGNPWLFSEHIPSPGERVEALVEHIRLFEDLLGNTVNFAIMKKHFKAYISGWDGARDLRTALMETRSASEAVALLESARDGILQA